MQRSIQHYTIQTVQHTTQYLMLYYIRPFRITMCHTILHDTIHIIYTYTDSYSYVLCSLVSYHIIIICIHIMLE